MAWAYFSSGPKRMNLAPQEAAVIIISMVRIVITPNANVTKTTPPMSCFAAGNIRRGMSGSQGPKTKMTKRIQGVILVFALSSCTWVCEAS